MRIAALAALLALAAIVGGQAVAGSRRAVHVQLLAINDFHGNLAPPTGSSGAINGVPAGGAEYLATHLAADAAQNENSLIIGAGDLIGASPLLSGLFHDEPTIDAMNAMKLSVTSVGNHEFDKGWRELLQLQRRARFEYLSANVLRVRARAKASPLFPPYAIRTVGGVKIGFIGETLKGTPAIVTPTALVGLRFLDEATTANAYARVLQRQGVKAIVLLLHQGGQQNGGTDPNGCVHFSGDVLPIVRKLSPAIKVVVSAHTHQFYNCRLAGHLVTSASSFGRMLTRIQLTIDPTTDRITAATAQNEVVTRDVAKDPAQSAIIAKYSALAGPVANRVVGSATAAITVAPSPAGESALGDVVADAQLASTATPLKGSAVVAFTNSGGIRGDVQGGPVTYADLYTVQPFFNVTEVLTLTGDQIHQLLEQQFDNPSAGQQRFLQVSNGFTYSYRLNAAPGAHVDPASIRIGGVTVGPAASYRVAENAFLATGGDGFTVFTKGTHQLGGDIDLDALVAYFQAHSPVAPGPQNRVTRLD